MLWGRFMYKIIGIIGALSIEIQLLRNNLNIIDFVEYAGFRFYTRCKNNIVIVIAACGVGKVNAASCTQVMIDKFNVNVIINTGVAGGLKDDLKALDIIISEDVTYHDVNPEQLKNFFPYKETFKADEVLKVIALKAYNNCDFKESSCYTGRIVTGDSFISDNILKGSIVANYNPYCVDMEGAAIGHVAIINSIPFLVIRSISDYANEDRGMTYSRFEQKASHQSASLLLRMIEEFHFIGKLS